MEEGENCLPSFNLESDKNFMFCWPCISIQSCK